MGWVLPTWPGYFILPLAFSVAALATIVRGLQLVTGKRDVDDARGPDMAEILSLSEVAREVRQ